MRRTRGITLVELVAAIAIVAIIAVSISRAYASGVIFVQRSEATREQEDARLQFEDRLVGILRQACLSTDPSDATSYFVAEASGNGGGGTLGGIADTLVFCARGQRLPGNYAASTDDFETLNSTFGPQGGTAEVQMSMTPVGDAGDKEGLFLREQRPADGDPTQGGLESLMSDEVTSIGFEFWDGLEWQSSWDTRTQTTPRLPAAIRVSYTLDGEPEDKHHVLTVRLPLSDVTSTNPVTIGGGTQ